jgi:hypothetical protein
MAATGRRYSKEKMAEMGEAIFAKDILPNLRKGDYGKNDVVAIEVETGEFEIDKDERAASDRLHDRVPNAQVWLRRVGSPYLRHFGGRELS